MADPVTMALIGAGTGAIMNKDDPLAGAAMGALGGAVAGPLMGQAGAALGMGGQAAIKGGEMMLAAPGAMGEIGMMTPLTAPSAAAQFATGPLGSMLGAETAYKMASPLNPLFSNLAQPKTAIKAGGMMMQQGQKPQQAPMAVPPRQPQPGPVRSNAQIMQPYNGNVPAAPGPMRPGGAPHYGGVASPDEEMMRRRRLYRGF